MTIDFIPDTEKIMRAYQSTQTTSLAYLLINFNFGHDLKPSNSLCPHVLHKPRPVGGELHLNISLNYRMKSRDMAAILEKKSYPEGSPETPDK